MARPAPAAAQHFNVAEVQELLVWTGHYDGAVNGNLTPATREAVAVYQKSIGGKGDGQPTAGELDRLRREGAMRKQKAGFEVIVDAATGIRIGIPKNMLASTSVSKWGTNWRAANDDVNVDTLRFSDNRSLRQLYDALKNVSGRQVRYSPYRDDWFVLEGQDRDQRQFYVRAQSGQGEIRGFSITYDPGVKAQAFPVAIAMASSFQPFPTSISSPASPQPQSPPPAVPAADDGPCFRGLGAACPTIFSARR